MAGQVPLFSHAIHQPLTPEAGSDDGEHRRHEAANVRPWQAQTESFLERHSRRPEQVVVGQREHWYIRQWDG